MWESQYWERGMPNEGTRYVFRTTDNDAYCWIAMMTETMPDAAKFSLELQSLAFTAKPTLKKIVVEDVDDGTFLQGGL